MALTFRASTKFRNTYFVQDGETVIGRVTREEKWTVRGDRIQWMAYRNNRYLGTEKTRKAAAELVQRDLATKTAA